MTATGTYTDARDGKVYRTHLLPTGKWIFSENFAWDGTGVFPDNNAANVSTHGRLYTQSQAIANAPAGCHLITRYEIEDLCASIGAVHNSSSPTSLAAVSGLRDDEYWSAPGSNTLGFSARPAGYKNTSNFYGNFGIAAYFITATGDPFSYTMFRFSMDYGDKIYLAGGGGNDSQSIRYIVDSGNVPDPAEPVAFDPQGGTYGAAQTVTLSTATAGADIYYTLDGSDPVPPSVAATGTKVDVRDGKIYKTVLMPDGKWWTAENLAWAGAGVDYGNDPANRLIYGRLYTWQSAQDHCPVGCHIPSISEWDLLTGSITAPDSVKLKSQSDWEESGNGTDIFGFNAKGGGIYNGSSFFNIGYDCNFWTNELQTIGQPLGPARARSIYFSGDDVYETTFQATQAISVRFIIDSGNIPEANGALYTGAITINNSTTLKAVAVDEGRLTSDVASFSYVINPVTSEPLASPGSGTYTSAQSVTLSSQTPGALVYYTTDGSSPIPADDAGTTGTFTDTRDGRVYRTVMMPDGKWWAAENLQYVTPGALAPGLNPANVSRLGYLYTLEEAQASIPPGAHLPTQAEMSSMISASGGVAQAGRRFRSTTGWASGMNTGTDTYGFGLLGAGFINEAGSIGGAVDQMTYLWTSTTSGGSAHAMIVWADPSVFISGADSDSALVYTMLQMNHMSVRFILDDQGYSTVYTDPIQIEATTTLKAVAKAQVHAVSTLLTEVYVIQQIVTGTLSYLEASDAVTITGTVDNPAVHPTSAALLVYDFELGPKSVNPMLLDVLT